jgi:probable rRNA maturation factor
MTVAPSRPARLDVAVTGTRLPSAARGLGAWLLTAAPRTARGAVGVALVSDRRMRTLNASFRGIDKTTDVLSFPADADADDARLSAAKRHEISQLGDIAIAVGVAGRQAREQGHSLRTELRILALHGMLHLLGYDHEQDGGEMQRIEERLRRRAGLPVGLITRIRPTQS